MNDLKQLCEFYVKREEIESSAVAGISKTVAATEYDSASLNYNSYQNNYSQERAKKIHSSRNKSFGQFLSQKEASRDNESQLFKQQMFASNHNRRESGATASQQNLSSFYTANYLEESMSYIERTAKKLLPILEQVKRRMIVEKKRSKLMRESSAELPSS